MKMNLKMNLMRIVMMKMKLMNSIMNLKMMMMMMVGSLLKLEVVQISLLPSFQMALLLLHWFDFEFFLMFFVFCFRFVCKFNIITNLVRMS